MSDGPHLITGGAGFIGAGLVRALVRAGHRVRVLDDFSRGRSHRLDGIDGISDDSDAIETITGDVRDAATLRAAAEGCPVVWHLAWINGTRFFYERPDAVLEVGIRGTLNAIDAALDAGARRFVFASTSEVYNQPARIPTPEDERLLIPDVSNPRFSYGGGKIAGELLTLHLAARRGLETVIFRPHNIYGPDMGFAHVIPEVVERIIERSDGLRRDAITLPIQGHGSETRAFCHIDDAAEGIRLAGMAGEPGGIYHVGKPEEVGVADLIRRIGRCLGVKLTLEPGPLQPGGTPRRCPDVGKLAGLGYAPTVDLDRGLSETVGWYRDHFMARRAG